MLNFSDLKAGKIVLFNAQPCVIIKCDFLQMQQNKPTKKCKLRNLSTQAIVEYTYKSGENIEEAEITRDKASYMYKADGAYAFMLADTYETVEIEEAMIEGKNAYLKEGLEVLMVNYNGVAIAIEMPIKVTLLVTNTSEVAKGNSVSDVSKDAEMETGYTLKVPAFIKIGEKVIFNTEENQYIGREQ